MKQQTLAMAADQGDGFEPYRKPTKRDAFLATMEQIVPWQALCSQAQMRRWTVRQSRALAWVWRARPRTLCQQARQPLQKLVQRAKAKTQVWVRRQSALAA